MFQAFREYALKEKITVAPGFASKDIRWAIDCSQDGRFLAVIPLGDGKKGEVFPACPFMGDSQLKVGGEVRSQVLWESAKVVLGWNEDEKKDRDEEKTMFFQIMLKKAGKSDPVFLAASKMLGLKSERLKAVEAMKVLKAKPTDKVTMAVSGVMPLRGEQWRDWWLSWFGENCTNQEREDSGDRMVCFLTGEKVVPALTHEKVTKLADTGSFGGVLAAFDKDAFTSFGLEQGQNAAMSADMASMYPKVLDHLLANHSRKLGPVTALIWFKESALEAPEVLAWLFDGNDEGVEVVAATSKAKQFMASVHKGQRSDLGSNEYYCLMLSGSAARVVVRSWATGKLDGLAGSVERWFEDLRIVGRDGKGLAPDPKFLAVVGSTMSKEAEFLAHTILQLWDCAMQGREIPRELMVKALSRFRSQVMNAESVLHAGVGLLKAFHSRKGDKDMAVHMNPDHPAAEYQCGRLLAVLSALQYSALGDVGAGVVQRYYGSASQTPKVVLGSLIRNSNHHLGKLEGGLKVWYQRKLADIMGRLGDDLPSSLTLEQQSLFALGYYQQMAFDAANRGIKK